MRSTTSVGRGHTRGHWLSSLCDYNVKLLLRFVRQLRMMPRKVRVLHSGARSCPYNRQPDYARYCYGVTVTNRLRLWLGYVVYRKLDR